MSFLSIDHVQLAIPADGAARAREFYAGVLGLTEVPRPAAAGPRASLWLEGGEVRLHLGLEPEFHPAARAHPAFVVADLAGLLERCRRAGARVVPAEPLARFLRAHVFDPFGNRLELMQAR